MTPIVRSGAHSVIVDRRRADSLGLKLHGRSKATGAGALPPRRSEAPDLSVGSYPSNLPESDSGVAGPVPGRPDAFRELPNPF